MELWVRSQDKERLTKATDIRIYHAKEENIWVIEDCDDLGYYQTKERALEVLDEIQNLLQPKIKYIQEEPVESIVDFGYQITQNVDVKIQEINRIVYKMPEE